MNIPYPVNKLKLPLKDFMCYEILELLSMSTDCQLMSKAVGHLGKV